MKREQTEEKFLTRADLAKRWGMSTLTVDRRLKRDADRLPALRLGRLIRVRLSDVEAYENASIAFQPAKGLS